MVDVIVENSPVKSSDNVKRGKAGSRVTKSPVVVVKSKRTKPDHPATSEMVLAAIRELKESKGSSLHAIKKYIAVNYSVDVDKISLFIRKYVQKAADTGEIVRTKGKGAAGSFRLPGDKAPVGTKRSMKITKNKAKSPVPVKSPKKAKKVKKAAKVTIVEEKKHMETSVVESPKVSSGGVKKAKAKKAVKLPSKAKKVTAAPVVKPKAPKPKKIKVTPSRKRAAAKKK